MTVLHLFSREELLINPIVLVWLYVYQALLQGKSHDKKLLRVLISFSFMGGYLGNFHNVGLVLCLLSTFTGEITRQETLYSDDFI